MPRPFLTFPFLSHTGRPILSHSGTRSHPYAFTRVEFIVSLRCPPPFFLMYFHLSKFKAQLPSSSKNPLCLFHAALLDCSKPLTIVRLKLCPSPQTLGSEPCLARPISVHGMSLIPLIARGAPLGSTLPFLPVSHPPPRPYYELLPGTEFSVPSSSLNPGRWLVSCPASCQAKTKASGAARSNSSQSKSTHVLPCSAFPRPR